MDTDEELLNFDLDDLSFSGDAVDDPDLDDEEVIELVDLVERGSSEDITRDLKVREWAAGAQKEASPKPGEIVLDADDTGENEEEADLDLSDLSIELEMAAVGEKETAAVTDNEITEADLEGLLQEDDSITLDFSEEEGAEGKEKLDDEITDADLQALLSEAEEQAAEEELSELEPLDIQAEEEQELELEPVDETQTLDVKPAGERGMIVEEPAVILEKEVEDLGVAAEREGQETVAFALEDTELGALEEETVKEVGPEEAYEEPRIPVEERLAGVSEERLEEIITNVVRDVVERVARETMAEVAERMIGEAIATLKQSLEISER